MAEAHNATLPHPSLLLGPHHRLAHGHRLQVHINKSGLVLYVPHFRYWPISIWKFLIRLKRKVQTAVAPLPLWIVVLLESWFISALMRTKPGEGIRSAYGFSGIWTVGQRLPFLRRIPHEPRIAALAIGTSVFGIGLLTTLHRCTLRKFLSYMPWADYRLRNSFRVNLWALLVRFLVHGEYTFGFQTSLPSLPLPTPTETVERYLLSMEPLLAEEDMNTLRDKAKQFLKTEAPTLQRYLKFRYWTRCHYMSDWWRDAVYLRNRDSLMLGSSYAGLDVGHEPPTTNQAARAAFYMHTFLNLKIAIDREELRPIVLFKAVPLCMAQLRFALSCTREAHYVCDVLQTYEKHRHFVVLYRGHFFKVSSYSPKTGKQLSRRDFQLILEGICHATPQSHGDTAGNTHMVVSGASPENRTARPREAHLAALTALPRDEWAQIREDFFLRNRINRMALETIESAVAFIHLSEESIAFDDSVSLCHAGLHGDGSQIWFDKSVCATVFANGVSALTGEHSWGDAPALAYVMEHMSSTEANEHMDGTLYDAQGNIQGYASGDEQLDGCAERIIFHLTPELLCEIKHSEDFTQERIKPCDIASEQIDWIGQTTCKRMRCSPDGIVQMALQLAYYRDQQAFTQTYESAMVRFYQEGRTETIRSTSNASCAFVRAMDDPSETRAHRLSLLREACAYHSNTIRKVIIGKGVDRHLFALFVVAVGTGVNSEFLEAYFNKEWNLSTSQIPCTPPGMGLWRIPNQPETHPLRGGAFAPVTDCGYGVCYTIQGKDRIFFQITANNTCSETSAERMKATVTKALIDMVGLDDTQQKEKQPVLAMTDNAPKAST